MKICPFISHMLGDDRTGVLEVSTSGAGAQMRPDPGGAAGSVALGYDGDAPKKTGRAKSKTNSEAEQSPLFCLKETCRFYQKREKSCQFDTMFDLTKAQAREQKKLAKTLKDEKPKPADPEVVRELDKFWRFQTKSAAEMISSFGEAEKAQQEALDELKGRIEERLAELPSHNVAADELKKQLESLRSQLSERAESVDNLSTTVSEVVINIEEGLSSLGDRMEALSKRIDGVESVNDKIQSLLDSNKDIQEGVRKWQERVDAHVEKLGSQQSGWDERFESLSKIQKEVVELIRDSKPTAPDPEQKDKRREAMKFNNLGVTSFHNGDLELARDHFLRAVALDESFAECFNNLGLVYTELAQEKEATDAFSRAIELNPDLHAAYNNLGYVFYRQGSYDRAIEMYNEALGRSADNSSAYTNLGNAYYKLGRHDEARAAWERAVELDPTNQAASQSLRQLVEA